MSFAGWAPAAWTPAFFTQQLSPPGMPGGGVNSATVPGAISGYDPLMKRFGTTTFKEAFDRAGQIAEEGWGQAERRHSDLREAMAGLRADPDSKRTSSAIGRRISTASFAILGSPSR